MSRRNSVMLKDIVMTNHSSKSHYSNMKIEEEKFLPAPPLPRLEEVICVELPDGGKLELKGDPRALADYYAFHGSGTAGDRDPLLANTEETKAADPRTALRKQSAIDEHERIRRALADAGVLLE